MKIVNLNELEIQCVSHNPNVKKRVLLKNGELGNITQFAQSIIPTGQFIEAHSHADIAEVFLVESGIGVIRINNLAFKLEPGFCAVVEPGEMHSIENNGREDLVLTYFGIKI